MRCQKAVLASLCLAAIVIPCLFVTPLLAQSHVSIVGSGSNVPNHLYSAWIDDFNRKNPNIQVRYLPLGTSESMRQVSEGSGDFGGGEVPLTREQMQSGKVTLVQIPSVLVGIVPIYNLPGSPELNFSGELLANIFLGNIKNWKDSRIAKLNPGTSLPDLPISIVHRTPGKGSNYMFSDFLSKTSPEFRSKIGKTPSPKWPLGADANRGEDMVEKVATTSGAIGYVEVDFARRSDIGYGKVQNAAGHFIKATSASIAAACAAVEKSIPPDFGISMTYAPGKDSYPVSSFTWLYLPVPAVPSERGHALRHFLDWALEDGQVMARNMGYATLTPDLVSRAQAVVSKIQ
jgi:phosphate transport system substrate-binding protein